MYVVSGGGGETAMSESQFHSATSNRLTRRTCTTDRVCVDRQWALTVCILPYVTSIDLCEHDDMYPDEEARKSLQKEFDELNRTNGFHSYDLKRRALQAAHRISLTEGEEYTDTFCRYLTQLHNLSKPNSMLCWCSN